MEEEIIIMEEKGISMEEEGISMEEKGINMEEKGIRLNARSSETCFVDTNGIVAHRTRVGHLKVKKQ